MKVLVACEESQVVCSAFRAKGHEAYSCDLQPCSGGHPEWHIQDDALNVINGFCFFMTSDNQWHYINSKWDLIIAHPPCTRLCNSGQRWLYHGSSEYRDRKLCEQRLAIDFFFAFVHADCDKIAIENPIGIMSSVYRKPDCIYNPYDFNGETECKNTCLWLKGLPPLVSDRVEPLPINYRTHNLWKAQFNGKQLSWNDPSVARLRSVTPFGVARAMADQWG